MEAGGLAALVGLAIHLASSAAFGIVFAAVIPRETRTGAATALGGLFGAALFLVMTFVVLRLTNSFMYQHVSRGPFFIAHLAYGLVLGGLLVPLRAALTAERRVPDTLHRH
jgi:hypothetical protein